MASTSITRVGGVTIVTQIISKDDASIPLQTGVVEQAPPPDHVTPPLVTVTTPSSKKLDSDSNFPLQVEPQCLGVPQVFVGLLCVLFSLMAAYSQQLIRYAPVSIGIFFVVSGSLAVAAGRRASLTLVWASLLSNVVGVLLGLAGSVYVCLLLAGPRPSQILCDELPLLDGTDTSRVRCSEQLWRLDRVLLGFLGLLLVLLVLQVCVSVSVCVVSGKIIRLRHRYAPMANDRRTLLDSAGSEPNLPPQSH